MYGLIREKEEKCLAYYVLESLTLFNNYTKRIYLE